MKNLCNTSVFIVCFLWTLCTIQSQEEDAWVFFTDKENVQASLENPITILTQKAIDRKNRHNTPIDDRDVPVNETYVNRIKNSTGITFLAKSKWFNCVFIRGSESDIRNLVSLDFVDRIDFADNALDNDEVKKPIEGKWDTNPKFEQLTAKNFDYGAAAAQITQLNADYLHENGYTGAGVTVAVMDSGFPNVGVNAAFERARSEGRLLDGYDFVNRSDDELQGHTHGAHTFSDIAGFIDGEFVGTAPDAFYHLFVTEDINSEGPKEEALWVEAAERADSLGVDVINTSLGYSNRFDNPAYEYTTSDMDGQTAFISRGANIAFEKGMLVVVSAGNSGSNAWGIVTAPGDAPGAFTIGAITEAGGYASFSSRGPTADNRTKPDVVARGSGASIVRTNGQVGTSSGTSFSSPIMAGAIASLWQAFPEKTNAEIMQMVRESAHQYNTPTNELGYGIPNFKDILQPTLGVDRVISPNFSLFPQPVNDVLYVVSDGNLPEKITIYSMDGKEILSEVLTDKNYVSTEHLNVGFYMVLLEKGTTIYKSKIVKQ